MAYFVFNIENTIVHSVANIEHMLSN